MTSRDREAKLAFDLCQAPDQLSNLLWVRYEEDFLNLTEEGDAKDWWEENIEIPL